MLRDLRYGVRWLAKKPGFTAVAVITMALGIGANTAIFSVVNAVLLRPLPYSEPERLKVLPDRPWLPLPAYIAWRDESEAFERIGGYYPRTFNLTLGGEADLVEGMAVTGDFFRLLNTSFASGRAFSPEDQRLGETGVAVVSHGFWQRRYGGDPGIIGGTITLDGRPCTVVGVAGAEFEMVAPLVRQPEVWVPLELVPIRSDGAFNYVVPVGRLARDGTVGRAQAELDGILDRVETEYPELFAEIGRHTTLGPLREPLVRPFRSGLLLLLAAVGCVLLIACCNVGNLLLARATTRQKEIAIRTALGASRSSLIRQLLTESVLLSLLGGALGVLSLEWGIGLIEALAPQDLFRLGQISVDGNVLLFTLGIAITTGIAFGMIPGLASTTPELNPALKEGGRSHSLYRRPVFSLLVICEVSVALVLMVAAGLMLNSYYRLQAVDPGFDPDNVLTARIQIPENRYSSMRDLSGFYQEVLREASAIPGVRHVGLANNLPIGRSNSRRRIVVEGVPEPFDPDFGVVSPDYFRAVGIPLQRGRYFSEADDPGSPGVTIIDEAMSRLIWPQENPIGKRLRFEQGEGDAAWLTIVGVVGDVRGRGLDGPVQPGFYIPYSQRPDSLVERLVGSNMVLVVRTPGEPSVVADPLRRTVFRVDSSQALTGVSDMHEVLSRGLEPQRFRTWLLSIFGALALALSAVGIYGVISFWISQRTREIGIRSVLGALPRDVLKMIVREGMTLALIGVGIGLAAAWALTRLFSNFLFEITASDPATLAGTSVLLVSVTLLASWIAARRATRVDPVTALHCE